MTDLERDVLAVLAAWATARGRGFVDDDLETFACRAATAREVPRPLAFAARRLLSGPEPPPLLELVAVLIRGGHVGPAAA